MGYGKATVDPGSFAVDISEAKHVITVSTVISRSCAYCDKWLDGDRFQEAVNHYLQTHGCILLHVGGDTSHDQDGKPWHGTVAVLASDKTPTEKPVPDWVKAMRVPLDGDQ
jgi:hypothetical protein